MTPHATPALAPQGPGLVSVDGRTYPLSSVNVAARADGGIAVTTLKQVFENPYDEALEVIYVLPLPADGAVLGFTLRIGEKLIRSEVEPREQAEQRYLAALYEGRTAGLLEQDRADTFQQRLGNIPPKTRAEMEIEVLQPLSFLAAVGGLPPQWEFRFPTVTSVRYQGEPGRVPDRDRLDVDRGQAGEIPTRVGLSLTIAAPRGVVASTSHAIEADVAGGVTHVRLREGERLDRDIAVHWGASESQVGVRVVRGRGLPGDDGSYALLTLTPPAGPAEAFSRDLTVLIDASGSMDGWPLEGAKRVATRLLQSLGPRDRFEVGSFASNPQWLTRGLTVASERELQRIVTEVGKLQADGGTEMLAAVVEALKSLRPDAQRQIVLITDGWIGFESEIIGRLTSGLPEGCRVHAVGIGSAPNRALLRGISRAGLGTEHIVSDDAGADAAATRLLAATGRPVLTDITIRGTAVVNVAPGRPSDVAAGWPLVLTAEVKREGGTIEISGRLAGSPSPWTWKAELPPEQVNAMPADSMPLGALHGRELVADLEQALEVHDDRASTLAAIERCALRHRIASVRTSLVAIADEPSVDPLQPRRRERLPVELPAGVSSEGVGLFMGGTRPSVDGLYHMSASAEPRLSMLEIRKQVDRRASGSPKLGEKLRKALYSLTRGPQAPAQVLRKLHDEIVLEFEAPSSLSDAHDLEVRVLVGGRDRGRAKLDPGQSSPLTGLAASVLIRLALRFGWEKVWKQQGPVVVRLTWKVQGSKERMTHELVVRAAEDGEPGA